MYNQNISNLYINFRYLKKKVFYQRMNCNAVQLQQGHCIRTCCP